MATRPTVRRAGRLDGQHPLGGRGQRVAAGVHRHRARVPGAAGEHDLRARGPGDRADHAERETALLQHRALLDVHLAVAEQPLAVAGGADGPRVAPEVAQRVAERHAVLVDEREQFGAERPGQRAAAQAADAEARALLIGEGDDIDGERQPPLGPVQPLHAGHGDEHAERPVVGAGVAHRVEVRAQQ